MKRVMMGGATLALVLVAAVPAIAQLASGVGQSPESGDVALGFDVANKGDYASQCTPAIQEGNTGNFDNAPSFIQSPGQAGFGQSPGQAGFGQYGEAGFAQYGEAGFAQYGNTSPAQAGFAQYGEPETLRSSRDLGRPVSSPSTGSVIDDFEPGGIEVGFGGSLSAECPSTIQQSSAAGA